MNLTSDQIQNLINAKDKNILNFSLENKIFYGKIVDVYDADTCKAIFYLNDQIVKFTIRLKGVDSPEIKPPIKDPHRNYQIMAAKQSRNRLIQLSTDCNIQIEDESKKTIIQKIIDNNKKIIKIKCFEFDKYGRLLAELYDCENNNFGANNNNNSKSFNDILIDENYAYRYDGGTKQKFNYDKYLKNEE